MFVTFVETQGGREGGEKETQRGGGRGREGGRGVGEDTRGSLVNCVILYGGLHVFTLSHMMLTTWHGVLD